MSASFNPDRTGLVRTECRCTFNGTRKLDGIRIFALMKVGVQAHHWSGVLFFYMGLLAASVKGEFPVMLHVVLLPCARPSWRLHTTLLPLTCGWRAVIVNSVPTAWHLMLVHAFH